MHSSIEWSSLEHALGPATDVPALLAEIAGAKPKAVTKLGDRLAHQGWCSGAVARVTVPLLVELTRELEGATLAALLVLLADLACAGSHEHFMGQRPADSGDRVWLDDPDIAAIRRELRSTLPAHERLGDRSPVVRSAAALLLAALGPDPEAVAALELRLPHERQLSARVDALIALGWLSTSSIVEPSTRASDPHERAAAWIATALGGRFDDDVIAGLGEALALEPLAQSVWARGDLARVAAEVLRRQAHHHARPDALFGVFDRLAEHDRGRFGGVLLKLVFADMLSKLGRGRASSPPALEQLDGEQRALLERLCDFDSGWSASSDQGHALRKLGIPSSPPRLREYLGHPRTRDLLDRPLTFGSHAGSIREVLAEVCTQAGQFEAPAMADAIAQRCSIAELPEVAELVTTVVVPRAWTSHAIVLHLLCDRGPALLRHARTKLASYADHGPPRYWDTLDRQCIGTFTPILLWVAVATMDSTATLPANLVLDPITCELLLDNVAQLDDRCAGWVTACVASLAPPGSSLAEHG